MAIKSIKMLLDSFNYANANHRVGCCFSGSFLKLLIFTYLIFFRETKQYDECASYTNSS